MISVADERRCELVESRRGETIESCASLLSFSASRALSARPTPEAPGMGSVATILSF